MPILAYSFSLLPSAISLYPSLSTVSVKTQSSAHTWQVSTVVKRNEKSLCVCVCARTLWPLERCITNSSVELLLCLSRYYCSCLLALFEHRLAGIQQTKWAFWVTNVCVCRCLFDCVCVCVCETAGFLEV